MRETWNLVAIGIIIGISTCLCPLMIISIKHQHLGQLVNPGVARVRVCLCAATPLVFNVTGPGKLLWRLSLWGNFVLLPWVLLEGEVPFSCASVGASSLMQRSELAITNQFQHPHLAFSGSNALCYFKDLCKHFVNRENVDQAVMIRGGSSQRGTPCTFLKKLP